MRTARRFSLVDTRRQLAACVVAAWLLASTAGCGKTQPTAPAAPTAAQHSSARRPAAEVPPAFGRRTPPYGANTSPPSSLTPQELAASDIARLPLPEKLSIVEGVPDYEEFEVRGGVSDLALLPDGSQVAVKRPEGPIYLFNAESHDLLGELDDDAPWARLAVSRDSRTLASAGPGGVKFWDLEQRRLLANLGAHPPVVMRLRFSDDSRWLVSASGDPYDHFAPGTLRIWDVGDWSKSKTIDPELGQVTDCSISSDGQFLAAAMNGTSESQNFHSEVRVWSIPNWEVVQTWKNRYGATLAVRFSRDSRRLAIGEYNGPRPTQVSHCVRLVDTATWQTTGQLQGPTSGVVEIAFSPDGKSLVAMEENHVMRLWDLDSKLELANSTFLDVAMGSLSFSDDGRRFAALCGRPAVYGHEAVRRNSPRIRGNFRVGPSIEQQSDSAISALRFSGESGELAFGKRYSAHRCQLSDWQTTDVFNVEWKSVRDFSPDLKHILIADKRISICNFDGSNWRKLEGSPQGTEAAVFSSDGQLVATSHPDSTINVWHLPTGKLWASTVQLETMPTHLVFSADGRRLASGGAKHTDGLAFIWQLPADLPAAGDPGVAAQRDVAPQPPNDTERADKAGPGEKGPRTSDASDAQLVAAYQKARELIAGGQGEGTEFVATLQSIAAKIPLIELAEANEPIAWQRPIINREGVGFGCLRFSSKLRQPADFYWAFVVPEGLTNWYIAPSRGTMKGFESYQIERNLDLPGASLPAECRVIFQSLSSGRIRPGEEYLLWFALKSNEPVEIPLAGRLLPTENVPRRFDSAEIAKRIGLPSPLRYRRAPSLPLERLLTLRHGAALTDLAFSADGGRLATAGIDDQVRIWDSASGKVKQEFAGRRVAFAPHGDLLATCGELDDPSTITIRKSIDGATVHALRGGHYRAVDRLMFAPDGKRLASGCRGGLVTVWDVGTGKQAWEPAIECPLPANFYRAYDCGQGLLLSGAVSRKGQRIVFGGRSTSLVQFALDAEDVINGSQCFVPPLATAMNSDGTQFAMVSAARAIMVGSSGDRPVYLLAGHSDLITAVTFSPDDRLLASASADHTVRIWEIEQKKELHNIDLETEEVRCLAFTPDGQRLIGGDDAGALRFWNVADAAVKRELPAHQAVVNSLAVSPEGDRLLTASDDQTARLWNLVSGEAECTIEHPASVGTVAFSPDGHYFASGAADGIVRLYDAGNCQEVQQLVTSQGPHRFVGFTADGRFLISVGLHDSAVWVWSVARTLELAAAKPQ